MDILRDPVGQVLRSLAVPMAVGIVFSLLVNVIDTYWAGHLGTDALAAMSFAFPVVGMVLNVAIGLMIGVSVAVAQLVGGGDPARARRVATHALLLGLAVSALITVAGLLTMDPFFTLMGAEPTLLPVIRSYMTVWYGATVFLVVPMLLNGVLRAHGDAITGRNMLIMGAVLNGLLDPLLIFGLGPVPAMGLTGAALASGLSRAVTFVYALRVAQRSQVLDLHIPTPADLFASLSQILKVGVPATLTNVLGPVAAAAITMLVARFGPEAVAAYGTGGRLDALFMIPALALSSGLSPFVAQNWGAQNLERVRQSIVMSGKFAFGWGTLVAILLLGIAPWVAQIFSHDLIVLGHLVPYLRIAPLGFGAYGVMIIISAAFNAVGQATRSTILSALRSLVLALPLAWVGMQWGTPGVFLGLTLASMLAAVVGVWWLRTFLKGASPSV